MEKNKRDRALVEIMQQRRKVEKAKPRVLSKTERDEQIRKWTTFYRRNIDIYIEERLRIKLKPPQRIQLHLMGESHQFYSIASRGSAKTYTVGLYAIATCMLRPYSKVVITASSIDQAATMVREKIENEIIEKHSPILKFLYDKNLIKINTGHDKISVSFEFNGSTILVLPPLDTSRGKRASLLIYEECRLLKKGDIDSIFEPMMQPRQARFLSDPKYGQDPRLLEEGMSVYITSARYKAEWFWTKFKETVTNAYTSRVVKYNFFAMDIYTSLQYGLKTYGDWLKQRRSLSELNLRMEFLNEMMGATEDAYFTYELFRKCQVLHKPFRPPTVTEFNTKTRTSNNPKRDNEYRFIVVDLASANSVKGGEATDNTVILCLSGVYKKGHIVRAVEYLETHGGGNSENTVKRIRELFWDYQADYIVYDARTIGEVYYNMLTVPYKHPERDPMLWNSSGFTVSNDQVLQVLPENKLADLRGRAIDPNAIPCMIPIQATSEFNSTMWQKLRATMVDDNLLMLIDELDMQMEVDNKKWFLEMDSHTRMLYTLPFTQTALTVNEGMNLSPEWREGKLKLTEPRSGTKDRMVALAYGNFIMSLLEAKLSKSDQVQDFSVDDWKSIFQM